MLGEEASDRLEQAARWYGMSLKAEDPLDGYLSVWIGLESVGPPLSTRVHKLGPKARCDVCKNQSGTDRDRGEAGIEHAIKSVAPELLKDCSQQYLKDIRNDIAHALKPMQSLRGKARDCLPDLQLSLIVAILTALRPDTEAPHSGRAILPREFHPFPDARSTVRSPVELIKHRAFFDEWLEVKRYFINPSSRLEHDGNYIWGAGTGISIGASVPEGTELEKEYVIFGRLGRNWESAESDGGLPEVPVVPWRSLNISKAWQYYLSDSD